MTKIKKINYCLLAIVFCFLWFFPVQSQTPQINITLTWSTDTYVPLDYPGKALPTRGSTIEIAANVDWPTKAQEINPQELIYNWFLDDHIQKADSGQGKQIFQFNIGDSLTRRRLVKVKIENTEGTLIASTPSYLSIKPRQPEIILEAKIPFLEPLNSIREYQISANQEIEFTVRPYFFNIKDIDELNYHWSLAGKEASQISPDNPNVFILKISQIGQSIKQELAVGVENKNNPLQKSQMTAAINLVP